MQDDSFRNKSMPMGEYESWVQVLNVINLQKSYQGFSRFLMFDKQRIDRIINADISVEFVIGGRHPPCVETLKFLNIKETISIHLGPGWYIENQDTMIEPKDKVEVTGSRITLDGKPAIIAAEVKKGEEILKLRNKKGFPFWSGWKRR